MYKSILAISLLLLVGCTTTQPVTRTVNKTVDKTVDVVNKTVDVTKEVAKVPIRTVTFIGKNGKKTVVNYYGTLEELNKDNTSEKVILYQWDF